MMAPSLVEVAKVHLSGNRVTEAPPVDRARPAASIAAGASGSVDQLDQWIRGTCGSRRLPLLVRATMLGLARSIVVAASTSTGGENR